MAPYKDATKNVYSTPWLSTTLFLFNGFFNLLLNKVTINPAIKPQRIAGNGSGFKTDVAPYPIAPYIKKIFTEIAE